jgi:hypothetical protein
MRAKGPWVQVWVQDFLSTFESRLHRRPSRVARYRCLERAVRDTEKLMDEDTDAAPLEGAASLCRYVRDRRFMYPNSPSADPPQRPACRAVPPTSVAPLFVLQNSHDGCRRRPSP